MLGKHHGYKYVGRLKTGGGFGNIDLIPNTSRFNPSSIVIAAKDTEFIILHNKYYKKALGNYYNQNLHPYNPLSSIAHGRFKNREM